ncbi:MAG: hypothetical protein JXB32_01715 [Deltaproteobacteria bacterium]|nr:hypothetical protein [Deltaproteobacteria bacterium]
MAARAVWSLSMLLARVVLPAVVLSVAGCDESGPLLLAEDGVCGGTPEPCESFRDAESCRRQGGCYWVYVGTRCDDNSPVGPYPCAQFTEPETCAAQVGCWWR